VVAMARPLPHKRLLIRSACLWTYVHPTSVESLFSVTLLLGSPVVARPSELGVHHAAHGRGLHSSTFQLNLSP